MKDIPWKNVNGGQSRRGNSSPNHPHRGAEAGLGQSNARAGREEQIEEVKEKDGKGHNLILDRRIKMGRGSGRISKESEERFRERE